MRELRSPIMKMYLVISVMLLLMVWVVYNILFAPMEQYKVFVEDKEQAGLYYGCTSTQVSYKCYLENSKFTEIVIFTGNKIYVKKVN